MQIVKAERKATPMLRKEMSRSKERCRFVP